MTSPMDNGALKADGWAWQQKEEGDVRQKPDC